MSQLEGESIGESAGGRKYRRSGRRVGESAEGESIGESVGGRKYR